MCDECKGDREWCLHAHFEDLIVSLQVQEQGEMAVRIDENIDDTLSNVESAQTQLLKYLDTISSNRWLFMKISAVLMVFMTIFIAIA